MAPSAAAQKPKPTTAREVFNQAINLPVPYLYQRDSATIDTAAQVCTLRDLGIQAEFHTDGRIEQLIAQLRMGILRWAGSITALYQFPPAGATGVW